jgi:hypothetical protein
VGGIVNSAQRLVKNPNPRPLPQYGEGEPKFISVRHSSGLSGICNSALGKLIMKMIPIHCSNPVFVGGNANSAQRLVKNPNPRPLPQYGEGEPKFISVRHSSGLSGICNSALNKVDYKFILIQC